MGLRGTSKEKKTMRKQTILSLAVIATLPLTAHADITYVQTDTPAFVGKSGTANIATDTPPYEIAEITNDDATHIASTAYVKGAYNDAIAGMNKAYDIFQYYIDTKQPSLYYMNNGNRHNIDTQIQKDLANVTNDDQLVNGMAVKNAINGVSSELGNKRVEIYTTWDDDTAKQQVAFVNAQ